VIECLPQCCGEVPPKFPVTTVENHIAEKYQQSYGRAS